LVCLAAKFARVEAVSSVSTPLSVAFKGFSEWNPSCNRIGGWASKKGEIDMLNWAVTFFIIALVAALLGFTGVAVAFAGVAKIFFVVFLVLFLVSLIAHTARRV
jgi:uncharacterized membrane protein YtjA (UPF0391 family)